MTPSCGTCWWPWLWPQFQPKSRFCSCVRSGLVQKGPVRLEGSGRNPLITHEDECGHTGFVRGNAIWPDFCVLGPRGNRRCLGGQRLQALRPRLQPHTPLTRQPSKATQPLPQGPRAGRQGVVGFLWLVPCPFPLRGCSKHTPACGCANRRSKEEDSERKQQLWDCAGRPCWGPMRAPGLEASVPPPLTVAKAPRQPEPGLVGPQPSVRL